MTAALKFRKYYLFNYLTNMYLYNNIYHNQNNNKNKNNNQINNENTHLNLITFIIFPLNPDHLSHLPISTPLGVPTVASPSTDLQLFFYYFLL